MIDKKMKGAMKIAHTISVFGIAASLAMAQTPSGTIRTSGDNEGSGYEPSLQPGPGASVRASLAQRLGNLPVSFEPNVGQTDGSVKFLSRGRGYELFLTSNKAVLTVQPAGGPVADQSVRGKQSPPAAVKSAWLSIALEGASPVVKTMGMEELPGTANYFVGSDSSKWRRGVPQYAKVKYEEVYPGVDLVFYGNQRQLEYDFVVNPGASPKAIALKVDSSSGKRVAAKLDPSGDLVVRVSDGEIRLHKPVVYQDVATGRVLVSGRYSLARDGEVRFDIADYDHSKPLVIDPVLSYSTYLGGSSEEGSGLFSLGFPAVAVDGQGNAYVAGQTFSSDFPTQSPFQGSLKGTSSVFISKIAPDGSGLVYSTYLGGDCQEEADAIAVDATGNAYITGLTCSSNFPTKNAFQSDPKPLFVTKLNAAGSALLYSTYFGGDLDGGSQANGIAADNLGGAYVVGLQFSSTFPQTHDFQKGGAHAVGAFVAKFNTANSGSSSLVYSTRFGGNSTSADIAFAVAVDSFGDAYVVGAAANTDFPTSNALQASFAGDGDGFITKFSPDGAKILYSTYLGGEGGDSINAIALDSDGNAYVTGSTFSPDFPIVNAVQGKRASLFDAFVSKISADGSRLLYSTYLGGSDDDLALGIALDRRGRAYVSGSTFSKDFPLIRPVQSSYGGGTSQVNNIGFRAFYGDAFVTRIEADGSKILYSTYLGGSNHDGAAKIAVDGSGNAYIAGPTDSADFPTFKALQAGIAGQADAFVAKIALQPDFSFSPITAIAIPLAGSGSTTVTVSSLDDFDSGVKFTLKAPMPTGLAGVFSPTQVFPQQNGSASGSLDVTAGPGVAAGTYTLTVSGNDGVHSASAVVNVQASPGSITTVIGVDQALGCIDNSGIVNALIAKLNSAQAHISLGQIQAAIADLTDLLSQLTAQSGKHISTTCTDASGNQFNPVDVLIADVKALLASLGA